MSYDFVLDCSITMSWCFEDEKSILSDRILEMFLDKVAIVPIIWQLEVASVLLIAERKKRITHDQREMFKETLSILPIEIDFSTTYRTMGSIYDLAKENQLSIYDACYLELAIRENIPIATSDKELLKAAHYKKISVLK
jgi:predicted nucleic acid-binding protein